MQNMQQNMQNNNSGSSMIQQAQMMMHQGSQHSNVYVKNLAEVGLYKLNAGGPIA
jgi:hypothetical protein